MKWNNFDSPTKFAKDSDGAHTQGSIEGRDSLERKS